MHDRKYQMWTAGLSRCQFGKIWNIFYAEVSLLSSILGAIMVFKIELVLAISQEYVALDEIYTVYIYILYTIWFVHLLARS